MNSAHFTCRGASLNMGLGYIRTWGWVISRLGLGLRLGLGFVTVFTKSDNRQGQDQDQDQHEDQVKGQAQGQGRAWVHFGARILA